MWIVLEELMEMGKTLIRNLFFITISFFIVPGSSWKVAVETGYTTKKQTKETLF